MSFLYPAFLWALLALGIPVIIHLFNFRRYKKVYFTNVRFLQELKEETQSKQKLKNILILIARCLAIISIVMAFAQPYFKKQQGYNQAGDNIISVFIDNSYSMGGKGVEGELLEQAKNKARDIARFFRNSDLFQLITNDFEGRHQRLINREEFLKLVDEVQLTPQSHSISEVLNRQKECMSHAHGKKLVYWLSDFQISSTNLNEINNDSSFAIQAYSLQPNEQQNVYIDSCWFESPYVALNENNTLMVRIQNASSNSVENGSLNLKLNTIQKAIASYNINKHSSVTVPLNISLSTPGCNTAVLSITDYPITFDDNLYFAFNVDAHIPVLSINKGNPNAFIKKVYESNDYFTLKQVNYKNINYDELSRFKLLILNEVEEVSSGLQQQLHQYVEKGGSLLLLPSSDIKIVSETYNLFLRSLKVNTLVGIDISKQKLAEINTQNVIFNGVFEKKQSNIDLPEISKSYTLSKALVANQEIIMKLDNNNPFFCKYTLGSGVVYLSAAPFNANWTSLPKHSLFVPLMYKLALLGNHELPLYYIIGRDKEVELQQQIKSMEDVMVIKNDNEEIIPELIKNQGKNKLYIPYLNFSGIYNLERKANKDSILQSIAFNFNRNESSLKYFKNNDLESTFAAHNIQYLNAVSNVAEKAIAETQLRNSLWQWFVILALFFLAAEIALIKFYLPTSKITKL